MAQGVDDAIFALLARFGETDQEALKAELKQIDEGELLASGAFLAPDGQIKINLIGVMEGMLAMAMGQKTDVIMPDDTSYLKEALVLFLKLNNTRTYRFKKGDQAKAWAARVLDSLFFALSRTDELGTKDNLVLLRMIEDPVWRSAFSTAVELYLSATKDGIDTLKNADKPAAAMAAKAFKASVETRRAKLPKVKYGNALADMRELQEYAVGQYLEGQNVNQSLASSLVQGQLGTTGDGSQKFNSFLQKNKITRDMFPTTVQELYLVVGRSVQFQESEEEISHAIYGWAKQQGRERDVEDMYKNFADAVFPVAAKLSRILSFDGLDSAQSGKMLADWMADSDALKKIKEMNFRGHVEAILDDISKDDLRNLNAFRSGRTESHKIGVRQIEEYARMRIRLLQLNAVNRKLLRVEQVVSRQMGRTEQFVSRPGKEVLKDMTFGVEEFFKTLRSVFQDIFDLADKKRLEQVKHLEEFNKEFGPLSVVAVMVTRDRRAPIGKWIENSRDALSKVPYYVYER